MPTDTQERIDAVEQAEQAVLGVTSNTMSASKSSAYWGANV